MSRWQAIFCAVALAVAAGCGPKREASGTQGPSRSSMGKLFYLDGAGNYGYGTSSVPAGLRDAGFAGEVEVFNWTVSLNPLLDQRAGPVLRLKANELRQRVEDYARANPGRPIAIVTLSAGSGIAAMAVADLADDVKVDDVVFLASSLSYDYDLTPMLRQVRGQTHVYYSRNDAILGQVVWAVGTFDGKWATDCMGEVGARVPKRASAETRRLYAQQVVNHPWMSAYGRLGYKGDHTSVTSRPFIAREVGPKLAIVREGKRSKPGPGMDLPPVGPSRPAEVSADSQPSVGPP